jgi:hypothetical protein
MSIVTIALLVLIVLAIGLVATGAVNLYASNPRSRAFQIVIAGVVLILIGGVYQEAGAAWAAFLFALAVIVELLVVLRKRGAT